MSQAMKLYTYYRSSAAFRARIALNYKGIQYESVPRHLLKKGGEHRQPEYLQANPQGLIPALEDDGVVVGQSLAILEYLEEKHPEPPLLPKEAMARAQVRSMMLGIACDVHPLQNLRVTNFLAQDFGHDDAEVARWRMHWISLGLGVMEKLVQRHSGDGQHFFGNMVTFADVCLLPQMVSSKRFGCDVGKYPALVKVCEHLEKLPAFAQARPEAQPDAE
jgi:maleylacetoacetate isomerase